MSQAEDVDKLARIEARIAEIDAGLESIRNEFPDRKVPHGPRKRAFSSLAFRKAALVRQRDSLQGKRSGLRLVNAVATERRAAALRAEAAAMSEDTYKALRGAVNKYGEIAKGPLAEHYLKRLNCGDQDKEDEAALALKTLFERIVDTQSDMKAQRRKHRPGWPAEGDKT